MIAAGALTFAGVAALQVARSALDQPTLSEALVPRVLGATPYPTGWRCRSSGIRAWRALWRANEFCGTERRVARLLDAANLERDPWGQLISLGRVWGLGESWDYAEGTRDSIMVALAPLVSAGRPCLLANDQPRPIGDLPAGEARGWALPGYDVIIHTTIGRGLSGPSYGVSVQVVPGGVYGCGARRRAA